jgi:MFS family permease
LDRGAFPVNLAHLLRENPNYRNLWVGQVISEVGDHFNNIAVFALAMRYADSGLVVAGVLISRAIPMLLAGPLAGVVLDRFDRKRVMMASDLVRFVIAILFIPVSQTGHTWPLFLLSAILMAASPFFTSGRSALMPSVATKEQLQTANAVTQTTGWATTAVGAFLGGASVEAFGYDWAFLLNALSFLLSAWCISLLKGDFHAPHAQAKKGTAISPWREYQAGLRYLGQNPLLLGICLISVGWATGGGAAQILFSLFGEVVFRRGPSGIGQIWAAAGTGLVVGGFFAHWLNKRISFNDYKRTVSIAYVIHGGAYIAFSLTQSYGVALCLIGLSRAAVAVSSVLNTGKLLRHVEDQYRGRVFATVETLTWSTMMISMMFAGIASTHTDPRSIGVVAGALSSTTAIFWAWANLSGRLPEPPTPRHEEQELNYGTR